MIAGALVGQDLEVSGRGSVDVLFPEGLGKTSVNLNQ
jgi:hypothetical protein